MNELLEKIQGLVEAYNNLPNAEQMSLVPKEYVDATNIPISTPTINVSKFRVCVFNDEQVGIFEVIDYSSDKSRGYSGYDEWKAGTLYLGYNSGYRAIKETHKACFNVMNWLEEGDTTIVDQKRYLANCKIYAETSFDDVRLLMYEEGKIGQFKLGLATDKDIIDVLSFANQYFKGKIVKPPTKLKEMPHN